MLFGHSPIVKIYMCTFLRPVQLVVLAAGFRFGEFIMGLCEYLL